MLDVKPILVYNRLIKGTEDMENDKNSISKKQRNEKSKDIPLK